MIKLSSSVSEFSAAGEPSESLWRGLDLSFDEMVAARVRRQPVDRPDLIESLLHGDRLGRRRGAGLELDSIGPYQAGDDVRHIDWLASARSGRTQIRRFRIEHRLSVMLVVDLRASMFFGTQHCLMAKTACLVGARIAHGLSQHHQSLGWLLLTDQATDVLRPESGRIARLRQYRRVVDVYRSARQIKDTAQPASLAQAVGRLDELSQGCTLLVLISDFSYLGEELETRLQALERKRLAAIVITDAALSSPLPVGSYPGEALPGGERFYTVIAHEDPRSATARIEQFQRELDDQLLGIGVRPILHCDPISFAQGVWR